MKWQNRGHEFDRRAEEYIKAFQKNGEKIFIFGAGYLGNEVRRVLERLNCFAGFIDNSTQKQRSGADGRKVMSLDQYMTLEQKGFIVIAVDKKYVSEIAQQLTDKGIVIEKNYFVWDDFLKRTLPILMAYYYNLSYVELAQISVTERCSLRCRKCAHACSYIEKNADDLTIEEVFHSADVFFSKVDLCREFVLIGGEPLLYQKLPEAVAYIGKHYREKMINFCITTNGTILPDYELLKVCKEYQVLFRVSNYSKQLPYLTKKYQTLTALLAENDISYVLGDAEESWMDYGFESVIRDADDIGLQKVFNQCQTSCREIRGSHYYYCVMARSVSENMGLHVGKDDFLDLEQLQGEYKKILMEFELGYSEKGYLEMCRHCNGAEAKLHPIAAAEQVKECVKN